MVRIIDGEIVQDDDPRVTEARPASSARAGPAAPPAAARPGVFDFSVPPLRSVPDDSGVNIANLPNLMVFGMLVRPQHALMLVVACMFCGWRGLLVGAILFYVCTANNIQLQPASNRGNQTQRMAAAQDYFQNMLGQAPLGRGGTAAVGNSALGARQTQADEWVGRGRARKLSDSTNSN